MRHLLHTPGGPDILCVDFMALNSSNVVGPTCPQVSESAPEMPAQEEDETYMPFSKQILKGLPMGAEGSGSRAPWKQWAVGAGGLWGLESVGVGPE